MRNTRTVLSIAALALLGSAAPAFADPPRWAPAHGYRSHVHAPRVVAVAPRWVRVTPPVARIVYRAPRHSARPVPVVRAHRHDVAGGVLAGAIAGAVIAGSLAHGERHLPAVAAGSVIGAVIGHEIASGY